MTVNASDFNVAFEALADRTAFLRRVAISTPPLNWPERSTASDASTLNSDVPIAFDLPGAGSQGLNDNGLYMIPSFATNTWISDDGSSWIAKANYGGTLADSACDIAAGVISGARGFLITGNTSGGLAKTINAGAAWTGLGTPIGTKSVLVYASGLWVAAGAAGVVFTSPDGVTWTSRVTPAGWIAGSGGAKRIVWNGSLFVIIPRTTYSKFLTSPDGITWTERAVTNAHWTGLAWSATDGIWMAASSSSFYWKSSDGIAWSNCSPPVAYSANDLAVIGLLWVVPTTLGEAGGIAYSIDQGVTWSAVAVGDHRTAAGFARLIAADGRFVALHQTGSALNSAMSLRTA